MNVRTAKNIFTLFLCFLLSFSLIGGGVYFGFGEGTALASESARVNTDRLNIRSGPGTSYSIVTTLSAGTALSIESSVQGSDGYTWYQVSFSGGSGWARYDYVKKDTVYSSSDSDFEAYLSSQGFPESYKNELRGLHELYPDWVFVAQHTGLNWSDVLSAETALGKSLVSSSSISSWKSLQTGAFDWAANYWPGFDGSSWVQASEDLVAYYLDPRNFLSDPYIFQFELQTYDPSIQTREGLSALVSGTFLSGYAKNASSSSSASASTSTSAGPGGGSSSASSVIIAPGVTLSSDASTSTLDLIFGITRAYAGYWSEIGSNWYYVDDSGITLKDGWYWLDGNNDGISECYYFYSDGTMAASTTTPDGYTVNSLGAWTEGGVVQTKGSAKAEDKLYVDIIMEAAASSGVSPYVIASTIIQEQGTNGGSELISGTNSTYPGYYNFFNTNAYEHDGMSAVISGLQYASEKGWDTIEKSIVGGAQNYGTNYVLKGQDTFYLKKFNVQGTNLYNHQYMTHILAAASEGAKVSSAYSDSFKNSALTFKIPVYLNMPDTPASLPTGDGSPNNKLSGISVEGYTISPSFDMDTSEYTLIVDSAVSNVNINAERIDSTALVSGAGTVALGTGVNNFTITVTAGNGDIRYYYLSITRREGSGTLSSDFVPDSSGTIIVGTGPLG